MKINSDFKLAILNSEDVNKEIIAYKNSNEFKTFLSTADNIMVSDLDLSATAWWKTATAVNEKLKKLRDTKIESIIKCAEEQQKTVLIYTVVIIISLLSLLLITIALVYHLITSTVTALNLISNSIKKIALGNINLHTTLSGNAEFSAINSSLLNLSLGGKEQIDLSSKISNGIFGETIAVRSKSDVLNRSLNKM
ncbi:MAG: methyl-accepting chemotaxis protein [Flavobacteriales bacterium]